MIAAAFGANSRARAANGGFIVLSQYDGDTVATSTFRRANMGNGRTQLPPGTKP